MSQTIDSAAITLKYINQTQRSVFLTGKAGTGKTTLLKKIIESTHKNAVVVAPTGIAALNAGGVTIHSMFQLPFAGFIPEFGQVPTFSNGVKLETKETLMRHFNMNKQRKALLTSLDLLIIDEVSMLRADLLDAIDWTLRNVRKINEPFGGVQVLFIGDLLQLPPVVKHEEWSELRNYYAGIFFFNAKVIQENPPVYIELTKIYRQSDEKFVSILNNLRNNTISATEIETLNAYVQPNFDLKNNKGYITLTTHNQKANEINQKSLADLSEKSFFYEADITGDFPPHIFPVEDKLELKVGAQIMFIKNDTSGEKQFYNGKMGIVKSLANSEIRVHFPEENKTIEVEAFEWQNIKYSINDNTNEIIEEVLGTFVQYPLKLAWAITVHKSQGLTFQKAVLDVSNVFAPGQAYVALSRLVSLDGLVLLTPFRMNGLSNDKNVMEYAKNKSETTQLQQALTHETNQYLLTTLKLAFDWRNLSDLWRIHDASYTSLASKSEKVKHQAWANSQYQQLQNIIDSSQKFIQQLERIFSHPIVNIEFVNERFQAAYSYFYKTIDGLIYSVLKKRLELKKTKQIKTYLEELEELDEAQLKVMLNLKRVKNILEALLSGRDITKELVFNNEVNQYKLAKIAAIQHELRASRSMIDFENIYEEEEEDDLLQLVDKKASKEVKKSTIEKTLELIQEGKSIEEISAIRVLSNSTIYSHYMKLIKQESIELNAILSEERIQQLAQVFEGYNEESLSPLKEKIGDAVSWDELKLFRASQLK